MNNTSEQSQLIAQANSTVAQPEGAKQDGSNPTVQTSGDINAHSNGHGIDAAGHTGEHGEATTAEGHAAEGHGAGGHGEEGGVFNQLIGHLADTHEIEFTHDAKIPLPYLFWDQDGFHMFGSEHSLVENPSYTAGEHGKPVRKDGNPISFDMSVTANVVFLFLGAVILFLVGMKAASQAKKSLVPKGVRNVMESLVVFIRDEIVYPNVDKKFADGLMPYFLSIFFFILFLNLLGLIPFGRSATGSISVTAALALCTFFVTQYMGIKAMGFKHYLLHLTGGIHEMDIALPLKIILVLIMVLIEFIGLFTKPFALAMRLFANMTAGHIIIVSLIGLAFLFKSVLVGAFVSVPFALFINILELLVAFLQAYVFTMLSALFIGMMAHSVHDEHVHDNDLPHAPTGEHLAPTSHTV